ncbi:MAG: GNAT family N-acetyltransferase [Candidatus Delongbacteria bacterium]|nr:GNAT family N-acetyltransferase [Candidatus Delongbacteria bacterium]
MVNLSIIPININEPADVEFVCRRHLETPAIWINDYSFSEKELQDTQEEFIRSAKQDHLFVLTARSGSNIIGFIWGEVTLGKPDSIYIISLWTAPEFRKQGVATALKQELEKVAKDKGFKKIRTNVYSSNKTILDLNLKLGYKIVRYDLEKEL